MADGEIWCKNGLSPRDELILMASVVILKQLTLANSGFKAQHSHTGISTESTSMLKKKY